MRLDSRKKEFWRGHARRRPGRRMKGWTEETAAAICAAILVELHRPARDLASPGGPLPLLWARLSGYIPRGNASATAQEERSADRRNVPVRAALGYGVPVPYASFPHHPRS